jgi:hypothetical protein
MGPVHGRCATVRRDEARADGKESVGARRSVAGSSATSGQSQVLRLRRGAWRGHVAASLKQPSTGQAGVVGSVRQRWLPAGVRRRVTRGAFDVRRSPLGGRGARAFQYPFRQRREQKR